MSRDKRPAFQFYPGDWLRDTALRSVSIAARGLWMDLICLMHDGQPYGHLAVNFNPIPECRLAGMVGLTVETFRPLLAELMNAGIPGATPDGVLYSRRMVKDERIRAVRSRAGKAGGVVSQQVPRFGKANSEAKAEQSVAAADADSSVVKQEGGAGETRPPDFLTACCVALNTALASRRELGGAFRVVSASSQADVVTWEADGIPLDLATRVIAERTARFRITPHNRQPVSLKYFDAAVREAHELAQLPKGAAPPSANPFDAVLAKLDQEAARAAG